VIIINIIFNDYLNDINLIEYCIQVIKKYKIICEAFSYRLPLYFFLPILKKYNKLYVKCKNDRMECLINSICNDSMIERRNITILNEYIERYDIYEKIDIKKEDIIDNINKNESLLKLYEKKI